MIVKSQVKYIQSLGHKKHRDEEDVFVAEGPKLVNELLNASNLTPVNLFAVSEWMTTNHSAQVEQLVIEVSESELGRISFLTTPNQVLGVFKKPTFPEMNLRGKISIVLDNIQDPGNLGTIVRTADWFGVHDIICSEDCADVFNPKVVQATMGSIARVNLTYTSLHDFLAANIGIPQYATVLTGNDVAAMKPIAEGLIIIGNEARGVERELLKMIEHKITIGKKGSAESLNAAVATGVVLSHLIK